MHSPLALVSGGQCSPYGCASFNRNGVFYVPRRTLDCFDAAERIYTMCCIPVSMANKSATSRQYTHAMAVSKMGVSSSSGLCTNGAATFSSRDCVWLEGIEQTLADAVAALFSCTIYVTSGTEPKAYDPGAAGSDCGGVAGRRLAFYVSSSTCGNGVLTKATRDASGCFTYGSTSSVRFCPTVGLTSLSYWVAYYCGRGTNGPWNDMITDTRISWNNQTALANAITAALGGQVTTPSGNVVTLDDRLALTILSWYGTTTVLALSSGTVHAASRHNQGLAIRVTTNNACSAFGCRLTQYIPASGGYDISFRSANVQALPAISSSSSSPMSSYGGVDCPSLSYTNLFNDATLACFETLPIDMDTSDYCSLYTNADFWQQLFGCIRLNTESWKCFWLPSYSNVCNNWMTDTSYQFQAGYMCGGVTMADFYRAICQGFMSTSGSVVVSASRAAAAQQQERLWRVAEASMPTSVASATSESFQWQASGSNSVVGRTISGDGDAAADDIRASSALYVSYGDVGVQVVPPAATSTSSLDQATISGAVILGFGVITAAIVIVVVIVARKQKGGVIERFLLQWRSVIAVVALGSLIIASSSSNWAQTAPTTTGKYTTQSPFGVCVCAPVDKVCSLPENAATIQASSAFTVVYMVCLAAAILVLTLQTMTADGGDTADNSILLRYLSGLHAVVSGPHQWMIMIGVSAAACVLAVISVALFLGGVGACVPSALLLTYGTMGPGAVLRIVEGALLQVPITALLLHKCGVPLVGDFLHPKRLVVLMWIVAPMALGSSSAASWWIYLGTSHVSPFTGCSCRGWPCTTTLGAHQAGFALLWVALSFLQLFVLIRVWCETTLLHHLVAPVLERSDALRGLWATCTIPVVWRVRVGRGSLALAAGCLGASLVVGLSVLVASECRMSTMITSYGFVFATLAFTGAVLLGAMELFLETVVGAGVQQQPLAAQQQQEQDPKVDVTPNLANMAMLQEGNVLPSHHVEAKPVGAAYAACEVDLADL